MKALRLPLDQKKEWPTTWVQDNFLSEKMRQDCVERKNRQPSAHHVTDRLIHHCRLTIGALADRTRTAFHTKSHRQYEIVAIHTYPEHCIVDFEQRPEVEATVAARSSWLRWRPCRFPGLGIFPSRVFIQLKDGKYRRPQFLVVVLILRILTAHALDNVEPIAHSLVDPFASRTLVTAFHRDAARSHSRTSFSRPRSGLLSRCERFTWWDQMVLLWNAAGWHQPCRYHIQSTNCVSRKTLHRT